MAENRKIKSGKAVVQFNGPVGQVITGGKLGRVSASITFDDDGRMVVNSVIEGADEEA